MQSKKTEDIDVEIAVIGVDIGKRHVPPGWL